VLESVVNVSEGRDGGVLAALAQACGACLLDLHSDPHHHRSVLTLAGRDETVEAAVRELARRAVALLDLRGHAGAHPRFGVLDVVPWVALEGWPVRDADAGTAGSDRARRARDDFALWAAAELALPVFLYGPERSLPRIRRDAWGALVPDAGPGAPHPTAGAVAVGCRPLLVAYNLWLRGGDLARAKSIAAGIRSPEVRALGFALGDRVQVSCNLVKPLAVGPAAVRDEVSRWAEVERAELVGLVPESVLRSTPEHRWAELDLAPERTIEYRLTPAGANRCDEWQPWDEERH
jgi:glutamate formiminotransferase